MHQLKVHGGQNAIIPSLLNEALDCRYSDIHISQGGRPVETADWKAFPLKAEKWLRLSCKTAHDEPFPPSPWLTVMWCFSPIATSRYSLARWQRNCNPITSAIVQCTVRVWSRSIQCQGSSEGLLRQNVNSMNCVLNALQHSPGGLSYKGERLNTHPTLERRIYGLSPGQQNGCQDDAQVVVNEPPPLDPE